MPEGKEDDRFDCEELEDRVVRTQELLGGEVKQEECVQSQGYGYVVDHCDIQVTAVRSVNKTKILIYIWLEIKSVVHNTPYFASGIIDFCF